jgi:CheY-like chemotaxis protein
MTREYCILQVEDDSNDVFLLEHAFRMAEIVHPLRVTKDGQEAIDYLSGEGRFSERGQHPLPRLVLLDLKMPRKNGMEVLEWIREHPVFHNLPVIIFSSSYRASDIDQAYLRGANSFVVKPPCVEKRVELARFIKGFWLNYNEPPSEFLEKNAGTGIYSEKQPLV